MNALSGELFNAMTSHFLFLACGLVAVSLYARVVYAVVIGIRLFCICFRYL